MQILLISYSRSWKKIIIIIRIIKYLQPNFAWWNKTHFFPDSSKQKNKYIVFWRRHSISLPPRKLQPNIFLTFHIHNPGRKHRNFDWMRPRNFFFRLPKIPKILRFQPNFLGNPILRRQYPFFHETFPNPLIKLPINRLSARYFPQRKSVRRFDHEHDGAD